MQTSEGWSPVVCWLHRCVDGVVDLLQIETSQGTLWATPDSRMFLFVLTNIKICQWIPLDARNSANDPRNICFLLRMALQYLPKQCERAISCPEGW